VRKFAKDRVVHSHGRGVRDAGAGGSNPLTQINQIDALAQNPAGDVDPGARKRPLVRDHVPPLRFPGFVL